MHWTSYGGAKGRLFARTAKASLSLFIKPTGLCQSFIWIDMSYFLGFRLPPVRLAVSNDFGWNNADYHIVHAESGGSLLTFPWFGYSLWFFQHGFWQCYRLCHRAPYCPGYVLEPSTTVECWYTHLNDTHSYKRTEGGILYRPWAQQ